MTPTRTTPLVTMAALALAACTTVAGTDRGTAPVPSPTAAAAAAAAATDAADAGAAAASGNPTVGGVPMLSTRTIVANAVAAPSLSTLVTAVKAAGLAGTLSGAGPFTLFAPTDEAFARLAPGTVDKLLAPENKPALVRLLSYHLVAGSISSAQLIERIAAGGGTTTLTTIAGQPITATMTGNVVTLTSVTGNRSYIETADVRQSNGIMQVVNGVLVPTLD